MPPWLPKIRRRHKMDDPIESEFDARRSLERALADLCRKYERNPQPGLARQIEMLRDEIEHRKRREG
jgi:hypothetical protein